MKKHWRVAKLYTCDITGEQCGDTADWKFSGPDCTDCPEVKEEHLNE